MGIFSWLFGEEQTRKTFRDMGDYLISPNNYKYKSVKNVPNWVHKRIDQIERNSNDGGHDIMDRYFAIKGKTYRYVVSYQPGSGTMTWCYWKRKKGTGKL